MFYTRSAFSTSFQVYSRTFLYLTVTVKKELQLVSDYTFILKYVRLRAYSLNIWRSPTPPYWCLVLSRPQHYILGTRELHTLCFLLRFDIGKQRALSLDIWLIPTLGSFYRILLCVDNGSGL